MKKYAFLFLLFAMTSAIVSAQDWQSDIDLAVKLATDNEQNILLVFQGSDWCAPCIKLEREIWASEEFKAFASNHMVLLKADFPRRKKNKLTTEQQEKNNALAENYNSEGIFPLVVIMDKNQNVLGKIGYKKVPPADYVAVIRSFEK